MSGLFRKAPAKTGVRRLLGLTRSTPKRPLFEPRPGHSLTLAAAGGGKTSAGAMVWAMSLLGDETRGIVVLDSKDGEMAAQLLPVCERIGRKIAIIDDFDVLGLGEHSSRRRLNPYGVLKAAVERGGGELGFATENVNNALIEEPSEDAKNRYWRQAPRAFLDWSQRSLLQSSYLAMPGGSWQLLADPVLRNAALSRDADHAQEPLRSKARGMIEMRDHNPEHFAQHMEAALDALKLFEGSSVLEQVGYDEDATHQELLREGYIVFLVGPQRYAERLGAYYALHLLAFMDAQMGKGALPTDYIMDEFTNAPLQTLVARVTTIRAYGGRFHMVAQSRSEIQRKYGEKQTATLEENAPIKQYMGGFTSFEEAERVSKAIGEQMRVRASLSVDPDRESLSASYSTELERLMTPEALMRMRDDEVLLHVKGIGWVLAEKIRQNEIAPYCFDLGDNPLEGGRLAPNPKITLGSGGRS